jgi:hypothetical protein
MLVVVQINMNWKQEMCDIAKSISTGFGIGLGLMYGIRVGYSVFFRYLKLKYF